MRLLGKRTAVRHVALIKMVKAQAWLQKQVAALSHTCFQAVEPLLPLLCCPLQLL
jgi:hypothetical protein